MRTVKLVMLRHGQSQWNAENRFTGWVDVDLSPLGVAEAKEAGELLKKSGISFSVIYTSYLQRAIKTMWIAVEAAQCYWLPVIPAWELNERHYGALAGLNKADTTAKYGAEQVKIWRRSYATRPPELDKADKNNPAFHARYASLTPAQIPYAESLADTVARVSPYFEANILKHLQKGENTLIVAHGNSLRALVQYLEKMSEAEILEYNIPTGVPIVYSLEVSGSTVKVIDKMMLGDAADIAKREAAVANQGKH